jgi:hypothetical protein
MPLIMVAHMTLARFDPAFSITEPEARKLATAWAGWRVHYGAGIIDPKTVALFVLVGTLAEVELPRVTAMAGRRAAARTAARMAKAQTGNPAAPYQMPPGNVVPMPGMPGLAP